MAASTASEIVDAILGALHESGAQAELTSPLRSHPRTFRVVTEERAFDLWVYIWTITHGGATRAEEEFRIQMTTVLPPLRTAPNGVTLLLGWYPQLGVFGGFDLSRHLNFSPGSNSVQISLTALETALNFSYGFYTNQFGEISVAFRPSQFLNYTTNVQALHAAGIEAVPLLNRVARLELIPDHDLTELSEPRRRIVRHISQLVRASNFSDQVLDAYGRRCAVTRAQLRLIDAAHIVPVGAAGSSDSVRNGIALAPTYHRAFDHGLIFLDTQLRMRLNRRRLGELTRLDLTGGLPEFSRHLERVIHLPADARQRPTPAIIRRANEFRRIPS